MQNAQPSLIARDDTFFGVCEALGEDFGFNPLYLRLAFSVLLLWNPVVVVGAYLAAGVVVAISRLISPNPRQAAADPSEAPAQAVEAVAQEMAIAA